MAGLISVPVVVGGFWLRLPGIGAIHHSTGVSHNSSSPKDRMLDGQSWRLDLAWLPYSDTEAMSAHELGGIFGCPCGRRDRRAYFYLAIVTFQTVFWQLSKPAW